MKIILHWYQTKLEQAALTTSISSYIQFYNQTLINTIQRRTIFQKAIHSWYSIVKKSIYERMFLKNPVFYLRFTQGPLGIVE